MKHRKLKAFVVPTLYSIAVVGFAFGMYFIGNIFINKNLSNNELEYVDGDITNEREYIPVVNSEVSIIRPYLEETVTVFKNFYDYESQNGEDSILYYEGTYMQNSGIDYMSEKEFDVVSILEGTVIDVKEDSILGTTIEIRHSNDLISVYQCLKDVLVKVDDTVIQGQVIAKSGLSNLNTSSTNNLHFELYYEGLVVNPNNYYDKLVKDL